MKAGLLPRLGAQRRAVYVEATPDDTEARLLRRRPQAAPRTSPRGLDLAEVARRAPRGRRPARPGKKLLIVLDQFEQWLHANADRARTRSWSQASGSATAVASSAS